MAGTNQNSPLNVLVFGEVLTKFDPDVEDRPGETAHYLDTQNFLKEADVLGIYNKHHPLFLLRGDGHVTFFGDVTVPGNVLTAPMSKDFTGATWVWDHNLGYKPLAQVLDDENKVMLSSVQHVSDNRLVVEHTSSRVGSVRIR